MDARIAPLLDILKLNTRLFLNCLDGVDDETAQRRPGDRVNNMTFIALHLVDARCYLARNVGLEHESPYKHLEDVASIDEMEEFPALAELRAAWSDVSERLAARLPALSDAVLGSESAQQFPVDDGTVLGGIAFLLEHESFHIGQLALLRKHFGLGAMSYPG
jgi:uncharacterized damage-inducible protein DinB